MGWKNGAGARGHENQRALGLRTAFTILAGLLFAACAGDPAPGAAGAGGPPPEMPPQEVSVVTVMPERVTLTKELPGRVAPLLTAEVRPQVGGLLMKRLFEEGADVVEGQPLYEIDPASYEVALAQAKATLARAEAQLALVSKRSQRVEVLARQEVASLQDKDDASAGVRAARADVLAARAMVDAATLELARTRVLSPITGRVGRNAAMLGGLAVPYQTALAVVTQLDPVYVDLVRPSAELLRLRRDIAMGRIKAEGERVRVELALEDGTRYPHAGELAFADATVDPGTSAVTLRVIVPNPDKVLLPGMYVRAVIDEGVIEGALLAPQQGVTRTPTGEAMAMVVADGDKVEPRVLEVARTLGDRWLVTGGLEPGARVIVEGLQKVQPGQVVKPVPFGAPRAVKAMGPGAPPDDGTGLQAPTGSKE